MIGAELMREVDGERDGFGIWPFFSTLSTVFFNYLSTFILSPIFFSSQMWGVLKEKATSEVKASRKWRGPGPNALIEAVPWACSPPSSVLEHVHSQQARGVCKAVGEAFPRQCYLLQKWRVCPHILHEADGFFYFPCGLKMKWTFNGMGWGIPVPG